ncbi:LysR family transcriptional regulator (plasmid) [Agrobacterium fabrum]|uniref:Transcriptional regulator, LysR family n=1 Tax=Agrobacterium fabrum TaxID=1176649 RepID=A0A7Z7BSB3_9HYPH|nr:LysR family transcriptional regulator [Agrobacterium fabrum]UXT60626.1 LysR family transcriptional regulator [Agrobacterium fabrum]CUX52553.1 putative Transcriptional activator protein LysR [Agrobacterium fabrum str. J-07]SDB74517.1 DNA-binding transcriptional regulator, LysR family [Agrobacterium fabrum]SDK41346.1 transcriptional regulator, LysR family [Agrobacterium fabrum]SES25579.1 DNA-binding transcriptional regulator, LysR family [Agrobacterium fabrum]
MRIRQIELFRLIVRHGTLTAAADALSITQPAASKLLSQLESRVGLELFERTRRRLILTREGEVYAAEVERAWESIQRLHRTAVDIRQLKFGRLNIAAMPSVAGSFLPSIVTSFSQKKKGVSISVHARTSERVHEWAIAGQIDIGFTHNRATHPQVSSELLTRVQEVCVMPSSHRLAGRQKISPKDLDGEQFVRIGDIGDVTEADQVFLDAGVSRKLNLETPMSLVACDLVANGAGVSLVDELTAGSYRRAGLVYRPFVPTLFSEIWCVRPKMLRPSGIAEEFLAAVRSSISKLDKPASKAADAHQTSR